MIFYHLFACIVIAGMQIRLNFSVCGLLKDDMLKYRSLQAVAIANETRNRAACYHLARHFENNDDVKQAIHFYTAAATYGNAIRICKVILL